MIIKSYLVFPASGRLTELERAINSIPGCEATPSTNRELLVLVTEAADEAAEKHLEKSLHAIAALQTLTLVSGHNDS